MLRLMGCLDTMGHGRYVFDGNDLRTLFEDALDYQGVPSKQRRERAQLVRRSLLPADEPTGNLDSKVGQEVLAVFDGPNRKGVIMSVVTHDENVPRRAKRMVRIRDGTKVSDEALAVASLETV